MRYIGWAAVGAALCVVCFFAYSFLPLAAPLMFNSPDENANHVFAAGFAETGQMHRLEALNIRLDDAVHPRSVKVVDGVQVPGGFVGLPLIYGILGKAFGVRNIPLVTPVLALLGVIAWGLLLRRRYGNAIGLLAAFLLAINPAWWYWSARTMMPNVPFISLLLISSYFFINRPFASFVRRRGAEGMHLLRVSDYAIAGVFSGLALAVRPVELYWLILTALAVAVVVRKLPWRGVIVTFAFMLMTLAPFAILNSSLYGGLFSTGYGDVVATVSESAHQGTGARLLGPLRPMLFPLGFAPRIAVANFWTYGLKFFWGWTVLVGAAVLLLLRDRRHRGKKPLPTGSKAFLTAGAVMTVWLAFFYGSYVVTDNPDPDAVTIGVSYTRYWLPLFVMSTLPVAVAIVRLLREHAKKRWIKPVVAIALVLMMASSGHVVFSSEQEGLSAVRATLVDSYATHRVVIGLTESNALIVVDRGDKLFYPERAVMQPLRSDRTYDLLPKAVQAAPTYYYGITFPERDFNHLTEVLLAPRGLDIEPLITIGEETLYRFSALDEDSDERSEE
ncbi:MAG: hypothetical protein U9Q03_00180 [Patescibacteria group bacterium]|nr:hypothetical protein [Patescibacteria group bacterium]